MISIVTDIRPSSPIIFPFCPSETKDGLKTYSILKSWMYQHIFLMQYMSPNKYYITFSNTSGVAKNREELEIYVNKTLINHPYMVQLQTLYNFSYSLYYGRIDTDGKVSVFRINPETLHDYVDNIRNKLNISDSLNFRGPNESNIKELIFSDDYSKLIGFIKIHAQEYLTDLRLNYPEYATKYWDIWNKFYGYKTNDNSIIFNRLKNSYVILPIFDSKQFLALRLSFKNASILDLSNLNFDPMIQYL